MNIHGLISTYFGDLEYDIGKSLNWTRYFCDTMYVMDTNDDDASRRYVVDWSKFFPTSKYSFYSGSPAFFGSPQTASVWRETLFNRADQAWGFDGDDWVIFVDGTECLNVFHAPPVLVDLISVDVGNNVSLFTTGGFSPSDIIVGSRVFIPEAIFGEDRHRLSGYAEVTEVDGNTFIVSSSFGFSEAFGYDNGDQLISRNPSGGYAKAEVSSEPPGFYAGDMFQSWLKAEIAAAELVGVSLISFDGWALVRSDTTSVLVKVVDTGFTQSIVDIDSLDGHPAVRAPRCDEFYVPMGNMVRLAKVSALREAGFDWTIIDQPHIVSMSGVYPADKLSLISYAYVRWAERPTDMTQSVSSSAPHYVNPLIFGGSPATPPMRPVSVFTDVGFGMRRLISTVRRLDGLPTVWDDPDDDGVQPNVGGLQKLDTCLYEVYGPDGFSGYKKYGGTPLYPGVLRKNLREGVWYAKSGKRPIRLKVVGASHVDDVSTFTTAVPHYLLPGTVITVYDVDSSFDGEYTIEYVSSNTISCVKYGLSNISVTTSYGYIITMTDSMGSVPWNYLLNTFSIPDPYAWVRAGSRSL